MEAMEQAWREYQQKRYPAIYERDPHAFDDEPIQPLFQAGYEARGAATAEDIQADYEMAKRDPRGIEWLRNDAVDARERALTAEQRVRELEVRLAASDQTAREVLAANRDLRTELDRMKAEHLVDVGLNHPVPKDVALALRMGQEMLERAQRAEAERDALRGAATALVSRIEEVHGPLDGSVSHGGQKVDGLRCDEPFTVRLAMRMLRALATDPARGGVAPALTPADWENIVAAIEYANTWVPRPELLEKVKAAAQR